MTSRRTQGLTLLVFFRVLGSRAAGPVALTGKDSNGPLAGSSYWSDLSGPDGNGPLTSPSHQWPAFAEHCLALNLGLRHFSVLSGLRGLLL